MVCRWQWWRQSGFASNSGDCSAPTRHWPSCFLRLQQQWPKQRQPDAAERPKWSVLWPSFIRANSSNYIYGLRAMRFVLYQVLCSPMLLRASVQVHSLFSPFTMKIYIKVGLQYYILLTKPLGKSLRIYISIGKMDDIGDWYSTHDSAGRRLSVCRLQ